MAQNPEDAAAQAANQAAAESQDTDTDLLDTESQAAGEAAEGAGEADTPDLTEGDDAKGKEGGQEEGGKEGEEGDQAEGAVPESPDGYALNLPEGMVDEPNLSGPIRQFAHEAGLSQGQFQKLTDIYAQHINSLIGDMESKWTDQYQALKEEWGSEFNGKVTSAKKATSYLAKNVDGFKDFLTETGLNRNPMMLKAMAHLGGLMEEGKAVEGESKERKEMSRTRGGAPMLNYTKKKQ